MTTEQQLLQAIAATPDDDTPRLIYADWLEERGSLSGEFIRLDCRICSLPEESPERLKLEAQRDQMGDGHYDAWNASLGQLGFNAQPGCFERGLPYHLHGPFSAFRDNFQHVLEITPWVTEMVFDDLESEDLVELAKSPALSQLRGISFDCEDLEVAHLAAFCNSPRASQIEEMFFDSQEFGDAGARAIANGTFRNLSSLSLGSCELTADGIAALGASGLPFRKLSLDFNEIGGCNLVTAPAFRQLEELSICNCELSTRDIVALASGNWPALEQLDCGGNEFDSSALRALLGSTTMPKLHTLEADDTDAGHDFAGEPIGSGLPSLKTLRLSESGFDAEAVTALAACAPLANVTSLELEWEELVMPALSTLKKIEELSVSNISAEMVEFLASGGLPELRKLSTKVEELEPSEINRLIDILLARRCQFTTWVGDLPDECVVKYISQDWPEPLTHWGFYLPGQPLELETLVALLALPQTAHVTSMSFHGCGFSLQHCRIIAASPNVTRLRDLTLSSNEIGDSGLAAIANSPHLKSLKELRVNDCGIGDKGIATLASSPLAPQLAWFQASENTITSQGASYIASSFPKLDHLDLSSNEIDDIGVRALAYAANLKRLEWLQLDSNPITDAGARELLSRPGLPALNDVDIDCEGVSEELQEQFPHQ